MVRSAATALTAFIIAAGLLTGCGSSSNPAGATNFTQVTGFVTNPQGMGVSGATISIPGANASTQTDGGGRYTLKGTFGGSVVVTVTISGTTVAVQNVTLSPHSTSPTTGEADIRIDASSLATNVTLKGTVTDTTSTPVSAALITVTSGGSTGLTTTSDTHGAFQLQVSLPTTLSVSKDGYFTASSSTVAVPVGAPSFTVFFLLEAPNPPQLTEGAYALTLTADSTCNNLPGGVSPLTLQGNLVANEGTFGVSSYQFTTMPTTLIPFTFGVLGPQLTVASGITTFLDSNTFVVVSIKGNVAIDTPQPSSISMPFSGGWQYCAAKSPLTSNLCPSDPNLLISRVTCQASNNLLTLVRK